MTFFANVSELAHELRHAAGTVLTILGSHLEAQERARVDEVGPQWLTEFEEQRDSLEAEQLFECVQPGCDCHDDDRYTPIPDDSAAVSAAADPSPTVGGEGPEGASAIPPAAPSGQPNTRCGICWGPSGQCDCCARLFGDPVSEDDLAARITAVRDYWEGRINRGLMVLPLSDELATSLLDDFNITRK